MCRLFAACGFVTVRSTCTLTIIAALPAIVSAGVLPVVVGPVRFSGRRFLGVAIIIIGVGIAGGGIWLVITIIAPRLCLLRLLCLLLRLLVLLIERLSCRHDPQVMLGVLEVVFRVYIFTGRHRVTGQLQVFVGNCLCIAAHFHVRTIAFKHPVERIGLTSTAAATTVSTAAAAATTTA